MSVKDKVKTLNGEQVKSMYLRAAVPIAALALVVTYGDEVVGHRDKQIPEDGQTASLRADALKTYKDLSLFDKVVVNFVKPLRLDASDVQSVTEGRGLLGDLLASPDTTARLRVGRSCLSETAYDITNQGGNENLAALSITENGTVGIYPASNKADPLVFRLDENRNLVPNARTRETLLAHDCRYLGELPVREAFTDNSSGFDWEIIDPLLSDRG